MNLLLSSEGKIMHFYRTLGRFLCFTLKKKKKYSDHLDTSKTLSQNCSQGILKPLHWALGDPPASLIPLFLSASHNTWLTGYSQQITVNRKQSNQQKYRVTVGYAVLCCLIAKSCLTDCEPVDCRPPGSSVHETPQARILEWVAISSSRASSWPRDRTHISCIGRQILYHWGTREAHAIL